MRVSMHATTSASETGWTIQGPKVVLTLVVLRYFESTLQTSETFAFSPQPRRVSLRVTVTSACKSAVRDFDRSRSDRRWEFLFTKSAIRRR